MVYHDFKQRYTILAASKVDANTDLKKGAQIILENTEGFDKEKYRLGHTKVCQTLGKQVSIFSHLKANIQPLLVLVVQAFLFYYETTKLIS
jgi:myosin heavy subunit